MTFTEGQDPRQAAAEEMDTTRRRIEAERRAAEEERAITVALLEYKKLKREAGRGKRPEKLVMQNGTKGTRTDDNAPIMPDHALSATLIEFVSQKYRMTEGADPEPPFFPGAAEMGNILHPQTGDPIVAREFHPKDDIQPHWDITNDSSEIYFLEQGQSGLLKKEPWYAYLKAHYRRDPAKALKGEVPPQMYGLSLEFSSQSPEDRNRAYEEALKKR